MNFGPIPNRGYGIGTPAERITRLASLLRAKSWSDACAELIAYRGVYGQKLFINEQADFDAVDKADKVARGIIQPEEN